MLQLTPKTMAKGTELSGEGCLINRQEGKLKQIKPDAATKNAQFVLDELLPLVSTHGAAHKKAAVLRHLGIEMWINLQKIGWQRFSTPHNPQPVRIDTP